VIRENEKNEKNNQKYSKAISSLKF